MTDNILIIKASHLPSESNHVDSYMSVSWLLLTVRVIPERKQISTVPVLELGENI